MMDCGSRRIIAPGRRWRLPATRQKLASTPMPGAFSRSEKHASHRFVYGGHDTAVCGKAIGGVSLWALGYPDQSIRSTDAAIALAKSMGHAPSLGPCATVRLPMP